MAKPRKKRWRRDDPGRWSPRRFDSTWREYRYGSPKPVELPRIYTGKERKAAVAGIVVHLSDWRLSPFEREGEARAGVRQHLCIQGHRWDAADHEAASLVAEGLRSVGAKRPSWEDGQWHYATPRENCIRCNCPIDDEDLARGFRYCSDLCARAYRAFLVDQVPNTHALRAGAYWQLVISASPIFTCESCCKPFKVRAHEYSLLKKPPKFCSVKCQGAARRTIEDRPCDWCRTVFRPATKSTRFCSLKCRDQQRIVEWKEQAPERTCPRCKTIFRAGSNVAKFCSKACKLAVNRALQTQRYREKAQREARCLHCRTAFTGVRAGMKFCSDRCRIEEQTKKRSYARGAFICEAAE